MKQKTLRGCLAALFALLLIGAACGFVIAAYAATPGDTPQAVAAAKPEASESLRQTAVCAVCGGPAYEISSAADLAYLVDTTVTGGGGSRN